MPTALIRTAGALVALVVCLPLAAGAAARPFVGPAGWDHTVGMTPTPQSPRTQETWKKSDGELITFMSDEGLSYDDSLAMIRKNVADNGLKPSMDKDRSCGGQRAHEIEMTFGTTIVHQIIIDNAPGLSKLTYTHPQGTPNSTDATSTITAYCGP
jgi:hypothetical protein